MRTIRKIITYFLMFALVLTGLPVMATSTSLKAAVAKDNPVTIGNSQLGAQLSLKSQSFDQPVELTLSKLPVSDKLKSKDFSLLGSPISVKVTGKNGVRLNAPATVSVNVSVKDLALIKKKDDLYAAYFNGSKWEYFVPSAIDTKNGIIQFNTYHFSDYAVVQLKESAQIERFATQMAINGWVKNTTESDFIAATQTYFSEAFDKLGISDKSVQGKILRAIAKENDMGALLVAMESNDVDAFNAKVGELTGAAILNHYRGDPDFMGNSSLIVGTAASALGHLSGGDYVAAQKAIASGMMDAFPSGRALKAAVEVIDTGINNWHDREIEAAYQAYKTGAANDHGYNITKGNFEELKVQMKGISHKLYSDAIKAYCLQKSKKESELSQSTIAQIRIDTENKLKSRFEKRLQSETEIQKQKVYYLKAITVFKKLNLLDRGSFGFAIGDNVDDRVRRLFVVKDNIQSLIGKEIPLEDMAILIGSWYNDKTKDKATFFAKLKALGYTKKGNQISLVAKPPTTTVAKPPVTTVSTTPVAKTYAWVLTDTVALYNETNWSNSMSSKSVAFEPKYAPGTYSVKTTYIGKSDAYYNPPYVNGESLTVQATWSKPPAIIKGGESIPLTIKIEALANTQSAYKWSGFARAFIDNVNITNKDGKYGYDCNYNTKYAPITDIVTAKTASSAKPGDQMIIETNFFSTNKLGHQYIYTWKLQ